MNGPAARGALVVDGVRKSFGATDAVRGLSLDVCAGEFLALLGPSGCGKTTLLRLLAGLERPDAGRLRLSGVDVTDVPAHRRPVNTVFQDYALFPHRDVAGNVAFGLEMARVPADETRRRVRAALELVRLEGLETRAVSALSGGQRQRVALARALVLEPAVLLLDEPLAALDWKLRDEMQSELKALQRRLGITFIFVTHTQEEAFALSDRIALLNAGRLEQLAAPADLYGRPRTVFAAHFLGVRNVLAARVLSRDASGVRLRSERGLDLIAAPPAMDGERVHIGFRPERLRLEAGAPGGNEWSGVLEEATYRGENAAWRVRVGEERLVAVDPERQPRRPGDAVRLSLAREDVLWLADGEPAAAP
jgi:spermidine/putrescine transport system ATP-binding protein